MVGHDGLWLIIWFTVGHMVYGWSYGLWSVIWFMVGHMVYGWSYGLWLVIWFVRRILELFE